MDTLDKLRENPRATLFEKLAAQRVGMLGLIGVDQHMQPMTHHADPATEDLWFITSRQTDLVRGLGTGARAYYCLMTPEGDLQACLAGVLSPSEDQDRLDAIWSPVAAAWFKDGRLDPDVQLLRLAPAEAAIWASSDSALVFGFEILRANLQRDHKPDTGEHLVIRFDRPGAAP